MSAELTVTLTGSLSGAKPAQRATVRSLGLRRRHQSVRQPDRDEIRGMIAKVAHLVEVRYAGQDEAVAVEPGQEPKGVGNPAAGGSVADEEVVELREAEDEALRAAEDEELSTAPETPASDAPDTDEDAR